MPFNGSGVFSAPAASFPAVTGTVIDSAKYNAVVNDIATALTTCITKDGQTTVTANLPMATYRHTGVSDATALTDYASANQVVDNALTYGGASAVGTDAYAVNLAISPGAYVAGNRYQFIADVANTGACTVDFSGLGAKSIKLLDGTDPHNGAIQTSVVDVIYDGTNFVLLNPYFTGGKSLVTKAELDSLDGYTGTTGDLNVLTGAAAAGVDPTEIGYLNGVTSGIQTQFAAIGFSSGTWTPTIWDASQSDSESQTYSVQQGSYTKIGNRVTISGVMTVTSIGTLSGSLYMGGLPFTSATVTGGYNSNASVTAIGTLSITAGESLSGVIQSNFDSAGLWLYDNSGGATQLQSGEYSSTTTFIIEGSYTV